MKEKIIGPAWNLLEGNFFKKYNFFPSLLSTIYLLIIILYQIISSYVGYFDKKDELFSILGTFFHSQYIKEVIIVGIIFFVLYTFILPIWEAGLIRLIDSQKHHPEKPLKISRGFIEGLKYFLPMYESQAMLSIFKFLTVITFTFFLIRLLGKEYLSWILGIMGIYAIIAFIANIFFAYSKFFIIFEGKNAIDSITASFRMALISLDTTGKLYITLFFVYLRTIFMALLIILFPFILSTLLTLITLPLLQYITFFVMGGLFTLFLLLITHLNSVLDIFIEGIWYHSYQEHKAAYDAEYGSHDGEHSKDHHEKDHHH